VWCLRFMLSSMLHSGASGLALLVAQFRGIFPMARYRRQSGVTVGGGLIRDAVVTAALFASELVVAFCKLVKLLLTGRGRDIQKIFESR
jgi:hypothetical protein